VRTRAAAAAAICLTAVCVAGALGLHADVRASKHDAALFRQKVAAITLIGARPVKQARRTIITENEVNAYLALDAAADLPAGVIDPSVAILGTGRVSGRAIVDLDAVRKSSNPTSMLDPMSYLTGRLPISATGVLTTSHGVGRFQLESATVSDVPVPKMILQQIVGYYSRTPEQPGGIGLDDPFALPARIREIQVERGQAIIVQ
jgi:hypothetical protein